MAAARLVGPTPVLRLFFDYLLPTPASSAPALPLLVAVPLPHLALSPSVLPSEVALLVVLPVAALLLASSVVPQPEMCPAQSPRKPLPRELRMVFLEQRSASQSIPSSSWRLV